MNVIIIVIDCLRYDESWYLEPLLNKYGFKKYMAIATAPWTIPSHASMLTGLYPSEHEAHETKSKKAGDIKFSCNNTLEYALRKKGYSTYLFTANAFVTPSFGFSFEEVYFNSNIPDRLFLTTQEIKALTSYTMSSSTRDIAIQLLKKGKIKLLLKGALVHAYRKSSRIISHFPTEKGVTKITKKVKNTEFREPFFLFMNLMELHEPYDLSKHRKHFRAYFQQLVYLEKKLRKLFEILSSKKLLDSSLVMIVGDHGQLLGEHGKTGHGIYLYDELLQVPLFINTEIDAEEGYISLANLRGFIQKYIKGENARITTDFALAETFGSYSPKIKVSDETHKIAIYYKGFKGIYNVQSDTMDTKAYSVDGVDNDWIKTVSSPTEGVNDEMLKIARAYLKKAKLYGVIRKKSAIFS